MSPFREKKEKSDRTQRTANHTIIVLTIMAEHEHDDGDIVVVKWHVAQPIQNQRQPITSRISTFNTMRKGYTQQCSYKVDR